MMWFRCSRMTEEYSNENLTNVSKGLFLAVCGIVGPECIVEQRRQKWGMYELLTSCDISFPATIMPSGSTAEGFNFKSSDIDIMCIFKDIVVHNNTYYHTSNIADVPTVLVMETENVSPGFTLLRCLRYSKVFEGFMIIGNNVYYSSKVAREYFYPGFTSRLHGPCQSVTFHGHEVDFAPTLRCPTWPREAMSFIHRSLHHGWPCHDVLTDICKDGCLLVPINSKQQTCSQLVDLEWRISFSLAEKKIIHSMNHCQFLCYGLMKIFLNEVLKKIPETGELLCSYFMKTAVFWEILEFKYNWSQNNFIVKFWNVFRRVMKWVSAGYCPNFFIPEHNMFYGKIYGRQQRDLMLSLRALYNEGYLCLLRCPLLDTLYSFVINYPYLVHYIPTNADFYLPQNVIEKERIATVITFIDVYSTDNRIPVLIKLLNTTASLRPSSDEVASAITLRVNDILQRLAVVLHSFVSSCLTNRLKYRFYNTSQSILRQTKTFFCYDKILHAVFLYRNSEYKKTIEIVNHIKQKLLRQPFMYSWNLDGDFSRECREHGLSYEVIVKSFIIQNYTYERDFSIEELSLEGYASLSSTGKEHIWIPPLVFLNFLLILCLTKIYEPNTRQEVLCELRTLVSDDNGYHINSKCVAISWEILGICQHLCGDCQGAYQSYMKALNDQYNYFKEATMFRVISLGG